MTVVLGDVPFGTLTVIRALGVVAEVGARRLLALVDVLTQRRVAWADDKSFVALT